MTALAQRWRGTLLGSCSRYVYHLVPKYSSRQLITGHVIRLSTCSTMRSLVNGGFLFYFCRSAVLDQEEVDVDGRAGNVSSSQLEKEHWRS